MASDPAAVSNVLKSIIEYVEKSEPEPPTVVAVKVVSKLAAEKLSVKPATEPAARMISDSATGGVESGSSKEAPSVLNLLASSLENVHKEAVENVKGTLIKSTPVSAGTECSALSPLEGSNAAFTEGLQDSLLKDDIIEEHRHWKETAYFLDCDPFLHHVNEYSNWYNNSHQFVRHQARPHVRPQALTTVTCAFGNLMAPKLVRCLEDAQLCVRQKALLWIVELVATPQGRYQCVKTGLLNALTKRFNETDIFIKQQIALAVGNLAGMQDACAEMSQLGVIKWLLNMVASSDEKLRELSLSALLNCSYSEIVRLELVQEKITIAFIMKTSMETLCERCATLGLKILQRCVAGGTDKDAISKLLSVDAISSLMSLLRSSNENLQEASMHLLGLLSMHSDGKCQAQSLLGIEALLQFLKKENVALQKAATLALMSLTVNIEAKKDFITGNGVPAMVPLIDSSEKVLSFDALQLATNVAEHLDGRLQLHNQVRKVQHLLDTSESPIQKRFAKACLQQLRFKHRPFT